MAELNPIEHLTSEGEKGEKENRLESRWALFTACSSFVLYFFGYLSLRFHLSSFGVATDLALLDERYLFAGAQFLVYLLCAIPSVFLIALVALVLVGLLLFALMRVPIFSPLRRRISALWPVRAIRPDWVLITGIVISVCSIQFVFRQCLPFTNLLLRDNLPRPEWMQTILLGDDETIRSLYFLGLVALVIVITLLSYVANHQAARPSLRLNTVLALLLTIQFLLLPVNFGVLIVDEDSPRVATLDGNEALKPGEEAWLIWDGSEGTTFFVRTWTKGVATRKLVTLDHKKIEKTVVIGYDRILSLLF